MKQNGNGNAADAREPAATREFEAGAAEISRNTIAANAALFAFKLASGIIAGSSAMVSDAIHSASDVMTTVIAYIGAVVSRKKADIRHPYGHERMECVASLLLGLMLLITGLFVGAGGVYEIIENEYDVTSPPGLLALAAALVSVAVKEAMYHYTIRAAKKIRSSAFAADAWHHRSDALSSIGALLGIAGARLGYPVLESAASVIISLMIIKVSVDILRDAVRRMLDEPCGDEYEAGVRDLIMSCEGVAGVDMLKTRMFGSMVYIDCEISVDGSLPLREAHEIAENVHALVEKTYPDVKHIMIHENPTSK